METENKNALRRVTDKLFGGLNMSWPVVILYAVGNGCFDNAVYDYPYFQPHLVPKNGRNL